MEWTSEVAAGDWVRERLGDGPEWAPGQLEAHLVAAVAETLVAHTTTPDTGVNL